MATKALARLGWDLSFLGSEARAELTAPGIGPSFPISLVANGDYYLDLVADPRLPRGMLTIAGPDPAIAASDDTRSSSIPGPTVVSWTRRWRSSSLPWPVIKTSASRA